MMYRCDLGSGQVLQVENLGDRTRVTLACQQAGQQQQATSMFSTGRWVDVPQVVAMPQGFEVHLFTAQGVMTVQIQGMMMQAMPTQVAVGNPSVAGNPLPLQTVASQEKSAPESPAPESKIPPMAPMAPMTPMAPMPPMTMGQMKMGNLQMGDMQMSLNPMEMRMGNLQMSLNTPNTQVPTGSPPPTAPPAVPATNRRFCPQCGSAVQPSDRFCASCGNALASVTN
ncbi:MAG: zinc ribbon domain-containing protein [Synechococcales bacterium]|nr:zinc ribbon domain-containing protein [Synechococcales bacterium]